MDVFEAGDTKQFTWQSSVAPDAPPSLAIFNDSGTMINSLTTVQSDSTHFYGLVTLPNSADGIYLEEWKAQCTVSAVGSTFPFIKRTLFNVVRTRGE